MHPFLQNKYVRVTGVIVGVFLLLIIILTSITSLTSNSTGLSSYDTSYPDNAGMKMQNSLSVPSMGRSEVAMEMSDEMGSSYYLPPEPTLSGYTSGLEGYETSQYGISGRTKQFDEMCSALSNLKVSSEINFKNLISSTNNCRATFYTAEENVQMVLNTLSSFKGAEVSRNTESVTRHRQQLQSQTDILQQQLASVQRSLTAAETQYDEIAEFAKESRDAKTLSNVVREKLSLIDTLTQRKINLTSQLNNLYQQATDLEERTDVVQFDVNVNRSNPIYPEQESRKWEQAWESLRDAFTATLIGLSATFGIFLLYAIQGIIYLLVLLLILRGLWKFIKLLWNKW